MLETADDLYQRCWDSRAYLRQYYAEPNLPADDVANAQFMAEQLRAVLAEPSKASEHHPSWPDQHPTLTNVPGTPVPICGSSTPNHPCPPMSSSRPASSLNNCPKIAGTTTLDTALEFGCGPTIHHAAMLVPFVRSIHLADYLPQNLEQVRRWLNGHPEAHNWDVYLAGALAEEGLTRPEDLVERKEQLRQRVTALKQGNIRQENPLGDGATYDLVASFYCLEAVTADRAEWALFLARLARLVRPGGILLLGAVRRCNVYHVFEREFPTTYLDESDFAAELPRVGFPAEQTVIRVAEGVGWGEQGFDSVLCVRAVKGA